MMKKVKTLILYEDGRPELERTAASIGERLDPERFDWKLRAASSVTIPEVLAAKLFFLGAEEARSPFYGELARLLKGINLAGRKAAYFGASGAATAWLREMAADSELSSSGPDLVSARPEENALAAWLRSIA